MSAIQGEFQQLLRELFRCDSADLDVGIYRIMNHKRHVIERFITFFSRYYQDGDYISKRRYSKKQRYAIPYNGEEVSLYWANHDQYYISGIADVSSAISSPSPHKGWHSRGYLPHFDAANTIQSITFRLHDAVPIDVIERWKEELHWREGLSASSRQAVALRRQIEQYADSGHGACYLNDERIARLVQSTLKHFDGECYRLVAWCIMPNHVHVLIEMMEKSLSDIVHSWKSYTAHRANELLTRSGTFWMPDYFDRYIRDDRHFAAAVDYIRQNPVKAGLVDAPEKWPWSGWPEGGLDARDPGIAGV